MRAGRLSGFPICQGDPDGYGQSGKNTHEAGHRTAGLPDLKFHDLRKTFASLLAQRGVSTAVTQRLLEHSSPQLTNQVYTNVDPVLRQAINLLPVAEWL